MLVRTADENYAVSRFSFHNSLYFDFFWSGLHALEKYYKAILLLNSMTSKGYSHDIVKLHEDASNQFSLVGQLEFKQPCFFSDSQWGNDNLAKFIKRMNEMGDANNRYNSYGYYVFASDLWKLDFLVWNLRRCCRTFEKCPFSFSPNESWYDFLIQNPTEWKLKDYFLLEMAFDKDHKTPESLQKTFFEGNNAFDPNIVQIFSGYSHSFANSPIQMLFGWIEDEKGEPIKAIEWALENIQFSKSDLKDIKAALKKKGYTTDARTRRA